MSDTVRISAEEKIFKRKRFDFERVEAYGFDRSKSGYTLSIPFMNGDFTADLRIDANGRIEGRVIDAMNGEEYAQLRSPAFYGAYTAGVRAAYEEVLEDIADKCCTDKLFASDQANRIADLIYEKYDVVPDFPWDDGGYEPDAVFRHADSRRWFGLIMNINRNLLTKDDSSDMADVMNLKIDPERIRSLILSDNIFRAYHMNHKHWISVILDGGLKDSMVMDLIDESYTLTGRRDGVIEDGLIAKVLDLADSIPYGKVATYGQIARLAGREKNARLVGKIMSMADRYGDHPCHRVVNHSGRTVPGWEEQRGLLEKEGVRFKKNGCVDMKEYQWDK
jgi:alkylated DNA nucleotide flippase Atl1/predicted DNA-binding protein (MmcQ/YjbR family)